MNCERNYGFINYPVCSNNGVCFENKCYCNSGWSSLGDFSLIEGYDCDINTVSIRVIGIISCSLGMLTFFWIIRHLIYHKNFLKNDGKTYLAYTIVSLSLASSFKGLYKFLNPIKNIIGGRNILSILTVVNTIVMITSVIVASSIFIDVLLKFLSQSSKLMTDYSQIRVKNKLNIIKFLHWKTTYFHIIVSIVLLLITPILPHYAEQLVLCYCCEIFFFSFSAIQMVTFMLHSIIIEFNLFLNNNINNNLTREYILINKVNSKLKLVRFSTLIVGSMVCFPNIPFAFWNFLRRKYIYLSLIECLLTIPYMWIIIVFLPQINSNYSIEFKVKRKKQININNINQIISIESNNNSPKNKFKLINYISTKNSTNFTKLNGANRQELANISIKYHIEKPNQIFSNNYNYNQNNNNKIVPIIDQSLKLLSLQAQHSWVMRDEV